MKNFLGTCVDNPFKTMDKLCKIIDKGKKITRKLFFESCDIDEELKKLMRKFPRDFEFYQSGQYMFYVWSAIEHFYI
jgi:hypothetical protein